MNVSFEDTETAFAYKSNYELKRAKLLFETMNIEWLVKAGLWFTPLALKIGLPVKGLIRKTIFNQFVGGETLEETSAVAKKLGKFHVKVILDYGVEGKAGEDNFEKATQEFIKVIRYAATQANIPFMSVKLTGLARFELFEKINAAAAYEDIVQGKIPMEVLTKDEQEEWKRILERLKLICQSASENHIGVLIDAEETWIQHPADAIVTCMMEEFNREKAVIYNTAQLYRKDRLQFVKDTCEYAKAKQFIPGMKLVRGAYMEKERRRAEELNYPSPIHETKEDTDRDFNAAMEYCIDPANNMHTIIGSHNEYSNLLATRLFQKYKVPLDDTRIYFSQLFGMSDNITFNLAKAGCQSSKYLPFGPIKDVIPYLMRRAQENSSVGGQSGRELSLIKKEIRRRKSGN